MRWLLYIITSTVILVVGAFVALKVSQHTIGGGHYSIPTASMMPTLRPGDQIAALPARDAPERGDVVLFEKPDQPGIAYIFRVIAIAGDQIQVRGGVPVLNGEPLVQERMESFVLTQSGEERPQCRSAAAGPEGVCKMERFSEKLPDGRSYQVLNVEETGQDNTSVFTVPEGHIFVLGDNRDNALDSRFPATGMIPVANITGNAVLRLIGRDADGGFSDRSMSRIE